MLTIIFCALLVVSIPAGHSYADYSENEIRDVQVVIRTGEWANDKQAKSGKRYSWGQDINISQHGISIKDIPTDIPLRKEDNQWFISEFDINLKLAKLKNFFKKANIYLIFFNFSMITILNSSSKLLLLLGLMKVIFSFFVSFRLILIQDHSL